MSGKRTEEYPQVKLHVEDPNKHAVLCFNATTELAISFQELFLLQQVINKACNHLLNNG